MFAPTQMMAFLNQIGVPEMIVIGIIALLIFGRRLPEVGRSLGKSFVEFKKGLRDTGDEVHQIKREADRTISDERSAGYSEPHNSPADSKSVH